MYNDKTYDKMLAFTRLLATDFPYRMLRGNGAHCLLVYVSIQQIENFLIQRQAIKVAQPESNPVTQLSSLIISNNEYERKGRLHKKSLNSDTFKERWFVLERDHLYYFKSEKNKDKNFNLIILLDAHIRLFDFNDMLKR